MIRTHISTVELRQTETFEGRSTDWATTPRQVRSNFENWSSPFVDLGHGPNVASLQGVDGDPLFVVRQGREEGPQKGEHTKVKKQVHADLDDLWSTGQCNF